jgi:tetratricopeptide (TPR) repeat protein
LPSNASLESGDKFALRFHLQRLDAIDPPNVALRAERSRLFAAVGLYAKAAADCAAAATELPTDADLWVQHACLQLLAGNVSGYEQARAHVGDVFRDTRSPMFALEAARIRDLRSPETAKGEEGLGVGATDPGDDPWGLRRVEASGSHLNPNNVHILALSFYRAGEFERCIEWVEGSLVAHPNWVGRVWNWLLLALSHQQLGRNEEAKRRLAQAEEWLKTMNNAHGKPTDWLLEPARQLPEHAINGLPLDVSNWLVALVLLQEARRSLGFPDESLSSDS